jgi:predicted KAP-like P-loop ATPase
VADNTAFDFSPERPILSRKSDLLDRTPFADQIADAIRGWIGRDSLVVGLYGEWGTGKSSLKNMVLESLTADRQTSPYIVEFNPWQWAGQDQLAQAFFREIGKELGHKEPGEDSKTTAKQWRTYSAVLGLGAELFAGTRRIAGLALLVIALLGSLGIFSDVLAVKITFGSIALVSLLAFTLLSTSDRISKAVANYFATFAEAEAKSLSEIKRELAALLGKLKRPMLVVMDDADRLTGPELRLLFQLIKANADFPNLVYLVLFQRDIVENILTAELKTDGREYLKKIVQVGFDIPGLQRSQLERVLLSKLDALVQPEAIMKLWDSERWPDIFIPGLRPYFKTLRDVYRFVSTLSLHIAVFTKKNAFEVNPIDLISLEVLRVFEPEVFKALPTAKTWLTNMRNARGDKEAHKAEILAIVGKAAEQNRKQVEEILKNVFAPAAWMFGGYSYGSEHADKWFREHRACHEDVFDKYFFLSIPEGDLSHDELERIVSLAGNREGFVAELRSLGKRNLLDVATDRLEAYKDQISLDHAVPFITALFDVGDELPPGRVGLSEIPPDMHVARIVYWYLKQEPNVSKRAEIIDKCIRETQGIYLPSFVVALEGDKAKESREEQSRLADDAKLKELRELCASKIRDAATNGTLGAHSRMGELLGLWQAWVSLDEVKEWVGKLIESREGVLSFLVACLQESKSYGLESYTVQSHFRIQLEAVERFVAPEIIERKLAELKIDGLEGKKKEAVQAFDKAMKRKREGKPPISPLDPEW